MKSKLKDALKEVGYFTAWLVFFVVVALVLCILYAASEGLREPIAILGIFIAACTVANIICDWVDDDDGDDDSYWDDDNELY